MNLKSDENIILPYEIMKQIDTTSGKEVHIGKSKSRVFRYRGKNNHFYYLKISNLESIKKEILHEVQVINWLSQKNINTAKVKSVVSTDAQLFFLMSEIPGESLAQLASKIYPKECMRIGASFLKTLHSIDINQCPFNQKLKVMKKRALQNIENNVVDKSDFDLENRGKSIAHLFSEIDWDLKEDLVFTHGDFCFPNIICQNGEVNGVVDLGRAGLADRYQDIALFLRSFKTNVGEPDINAFLQHYELIDKIDAVKISLFKKIDEFF